MWRELAWTDGSEAHIARHGVMPAEVEEIANTRPRYEALGRDGTSLLYGQTDAGRRLLVVLTQADTQPGSWHVVTARDMTARESRTFRQKGR